MTGFLLKIGTLDPTVLLPKFRQDSIRIVKIRRIHRLTLAVHDIDGARLTFEQLLDSHAGDSRVIRDFMVRAVDIPMADTQLQLVSPLATDNPLKSYLQRKGEGFYNLALEVADLDEALTELAGLGIKVSEPVEAEPGVRSSFVTAAATHGLSLQLVEVRRAEGEPEVGPVTVVEEPRAEHLAAAELAVEAAPNAEPHPAAAAAAGEWVDREDASAPEKAPLDLTPDEWSDAD